MTGKKYHNKNTANVQVKKNCKDLSCQARLIKHLHFEEIDSTNTWAKSHLNQWAPKGVTLITASGQTAGRGRFKRRWESPSHVNIYATFCFWFDLKRKDMGYIPQLLALAAVQVLEKQGFVPTIKWPNDILLNGKKVAGILCETVAEPTQRGIVCGIGLNVNMPREMLNQIDRPATSLLIEKGHTFEVQLILDDLQHSFMAFLEQFMQKGFINFFPSLQSKSTFKKGQKIRFHDNQAFIEAQFETLHADGSVELRLMDGTFKFFKVGEFLN